MPMLVKKPADDLECERHPPSAVGGTPQSAWGTARAGSEPKLWLGPAALRRRLSTTARTGPRRAADLPQRRSALPQTSWREFGEFRDSCGTALSCDKTISPLSLSILGLRVCSISGLGLRFAGYRFVGRRRDVLRRGCSSGSSYGARPRHRFDDVLRDGNDVLVGADGARYVAEAHRWHL